MKNIVLVSLFVLVLSCKKDDPITLDSPMATAASDITNSQFMANFDNVTGATGYDLDIATDVAFTNIIETKTNLGGSTIVDGLDGNTNYAYRVKATASEATSSDYSNTIEVTTDPDAPIATDATNITSTGFTANWNAVDNLTDYVLYVSEDNFPADPPNNIPGYDGTPINGTSETITGLKSGTIYYYVVKANADARVSAISNSIQTQTSN